MYSHQDGAARGNQESGRSNLESGRQDLNHEKELDLSNRSQRSVTAPGRSEPPETGLNLALSNLGAKSASSAPVPSPTQGLNLSGARPPPSSVLPISVPSAPYTSRDLAPFNVPSSSLLIIPYSSGAPQYSTPPSVPFTTTGSVTSPVGVSGPRPGLYSPVSGPTQYSPTSRPVPYSPGSRPAPYSPATGSAPISSGVGSAPFNSGPGPANLSQGAKPTSFTQQERNK